MGPDKLQTLKQVLVDYNVTGPTQNKADRINNVKDQQGPFSVREIVNYFIAQKNRAAAKEVCQIMVLHANDGILIDMNKVGDQFLMGQAMEALRDAPELGVSDDDRLNVLSLNPEPITLADKYSLGQVRVGDIERAEALP